MTNLQFTWWQDGEFYLGHLDEYPDYETQGLSLEELEANLRDIFHDISSGEITGIRHSGVLTIA